MHFPFAACLPMSFWSVTTQKTCVMHWSGEKRLDTLVAYLLELFSSLSSDQAPHVIVPPPTFARTSRIDVRGCVE